MKRNLSKLTALGLCLTLLIGNAAAYTLIDREKSTAAKNTDTAQTAGVSKDETVYVLADAEGGVQKIIVSDWIKNPQGSSTVTDTAVLTDVENVRGDETYTMNGDNLRVWDAQGNDIYCQGSVDKELPVGISVSYELDGKSISAEELAGKSGTVTIRYTYQNYQYETVEIDGKQEKIYVPFAMLTGLLLDGDRFSNVTVTNGKVINDGTRTVVVGLALPGLQENLKIDTDKLELPQSVEITADVKDFKLGNTVTLATNSMFNKLDAEQFNSLDGLTDSLGDLTDAMGKLMSGSSQLYDGLCTLLEKSGQLVDGINQMASGAEALKNGAAQVDGGAAALVSGSKELADGLGTLSANSAALNGGAAQVFNTLLQTANTELAKAGLDVPTLTIGNYADVLNGVIDSLDPDSIAQQIQQTARTQVTEKVNAQIDVIRAAVTAEVEKQVRAGVEDYCRTQVALPQVLAAMGMTAEDYNAGVTSGAISEEVQAQVNAAVDAAMASEEMKAAVDAQVAAKMASDEMKATVEQNVSAEIERQIELAMNSAEVQGQITAALEQAASGAASVSALKEQLDTYAGFYYGLQSYTAGVDSARSGADTLNAGAATLKNGTASLKDGMDTLYNGVLTLRNGAPALVSGVTELRDGALQLSDGLKEFDKQGVEKLVDAVDGDIGGLLTRLKATVDVSKDYQSFTGLTEDMTGEVRFIYRTDAIEIDE